MEWLNFGYHILSSGLVPHRLGYPLAVATRPSFLTQQLEVPAPDAITNGFHRVCKGDAERSIEDSFL